MPFLVLGLAALFAGLVGWKLNAMEQERKLLSPGPVLRPAVAATAKTGAARAARAARAVGDTVFCLHQRRWGTIETLAPSGRGFVYGVRLCNGLGVVVRDTDLVR